MTIDDEPIAGRVLLGEHASGYVLAARNASDEIPVIGVWNAVCASAPGSELVPFFFFRHLSHVSAPWPRADSQCARKALAEGKEVTLWKLCTGTQRV